MESGYDMPPVRLTDMAATPAPWWKDLWLRYWLVALLVAIVTLLHYNTAIHIHAAHGIYRRLYYFPIIIGAFRGGWIGGTGTALLVCALYIPHAFGVIGFDPAPTLEKILEMILYVAVGLLSGSLVTRIGKALAIQLQTAHDLRQALDEKSAMEAELVRSARLAAVGRLSAGLAHEIRNPLASIQGSAEVLADDFPQDSPKLRMLEIMQRETGRLNQVLTRFLAFARGEAGETQPFDLSSESEAVVELMSHRPEAATTTLTVQADARSLAVGNAEQIRQVLLNLAINGSAAAGPDGWVRLEISETDGRCECRVFDSGPGFTEEAVANFGTPFFSTKEGGTGLGLATSLRIVEDQDGRLFVDPEPAGGACVVLSLPADG